MLRRRATVRLYLHDPIPALHNDSLLRRLYLCNVPRHHQYGASTTCFQIWHDQWECGSKLPTLANKKIQMRRPGKKRSARQLYVDDEEEKDGEENDAGQDSD